jgi:hypothetical protein
MSMGSWSKSEVEYGRKILVSGLDGARSGQRAFLQGQGLAPFLRESVQNGLKPAAMGTCIGALAGCFGSGHRSIVKVLAFSLLGCAIGFGAGMFWENRGLAASVADGALRNIDKARDEHWLEKHPIDYA